MELNQNECVITYNNLQVLMWLNNMGIWGEIITTPVPSQVKGRIVIGEIPYYMAILAKCVYVVEVGSSNYVKDLTFEDMIGMGASLKKYTICRG